MQPVALFLEHWRKTAWQTSNPSDSVDNHVPKNHNELAQEALMKAGYASVPVSGSGRRYFDSLRWCANHMGFNDYIRCHTRLFFNDPEMAMVYRLTWGDAS